jgi:hypothetical protein
MTQTGLVKKIVASLRQGLQYTAEYIADDSLFRERRSFRLRQPRVRTVYSPCARVPDSGRNVANLI